MTSEPLPLFTDAAGDTPWEPPLAGTEAEQLLGALDRMRWTFRYKCGDLDAAGLRATIGASSLTLGGLLEHLAANEDQKSTVKLTGEPMGEVWADHGWDGDDDWEFGSSLEDSPETLYALYDGAVARARGRYAAAIKASGLDGPIHLSQVVGAPVTLRRLLMDMLEEYGRHTGHADLLREAVDGRTGEDPSPGWRP